MDVPTSTRRITHIGDAIVMRLAHEDETVERGIEHVLRQHPATRQTPGNTPATRQPDPATPGNPATRAQDNIQTHYDELLKLIIRAQAPQRQVSSRVLAKGWRVSLAPARKLAIRCHVVDFSRGHFCVRSRCDSDTTALRGSWRAATRLWRAAVRGSRRAATRLWRAATRLEAGRYAAMAGGPLRGTSSRPRRGLGAAA